MRFPSALVAVATALSLSPAATAVANYANDFIHPSYILDFQYQNVTVPAQQTVIQWANALNLASPWSECKTGWQMADVGPVRVMPWHRPTRFGRVERCGVARQVGEISPSSLSSGVAVAAVRAAASD